METVLDLPTTKSTARKSYGLNPVNENFYNVFKASFNYQSSWLQYKVDCGPFLESLKSKSLTSISPVDVENYVMAHADNEHTQNNKRAHIRSMIKFMINNNVNDAKNKVSRDLLIYLI